IARSRSVCLSEALTTRVWESYSRPEVAWRNRTVRRRVPWRPPAGITKFRVSAVLDRSCAYDSVTEADTTPVPVGVRVATGNQRNPKDLRSSVSEAVTDLS